MKIISPFAQCLLLMTILFGLTGFANAQITDESEDVIITQEFREVMKSFDDFSWFEDGYAIVEKGRKKGLIDVKGRIVVPLEYSYLQREILTNVTGYYKADKNKKCGYIDIHNNIVIPIEYDLVYHFDGNVAVVEKDGKFGMVNTAGDYLIPLQYDKFHIQTYDKASQWIAVVQKDGKYGTINENGNTIIPLVYDKLTFDNGYFIASKDNKEGVLDTNGSIIIPFVFDKIYRFVKGFVDGSKDGRDYFAGEKTYAYYNGKDMVYLPYEKIDRFNEGFAVVGKRGKYGIVDGNGNVIVPIQYDYIDDSDFKHGLAEVYLGKKKGIVNIKGNFIIPLQNYQSLGIYNNGFIFVEKNGKEGCYNKEGRLIMPFDYDDIWFFKDFEPYALVRRNNIYEVVDTNGETILTIPYNIVGGFENGLAVVIKDGKYGIINTKGELVTPLQYDDIGCGFGSRYGFYVKKDGKYGFLNRKGEIAVPCDYDEIAFTKSFGNGLVVKKDGKWGVVDTNGFVIIAPFFENPPSVSGPDNGCYVVQYKIKHTGDIGERSATVSGYADRYGNLLITNDMIEERKQKLIEEYKKSQEIIAEKERQRRIEEERLAEERRREEQARKARERAAANSRQNYDINDISWLYGSWRLETGGFIFWVKITENKLTWEALSYPGIKDVLWNGSYKLYMNRIEINGTTAFKVDLYKRRIYSLKGEAFQKR